MVAVEKSASELSGADLDVTDSKAAAQRSRKGAALGALSRALAASDAASAAGAAADADASSDADADAPAAAAAAADVGGVSVADIKAQKVSSYAPAILRGVLSVLSCILGESKPSRYDPLVEAEKFVAEHIHRFKTQLLARAPSTAPHRHGPPQRCRAARPTTRDLLGEGWVPSLSVCDIPLTSALLPAVLFLFTGETR